METSRSSFDVDRSILAVGLLVFILNRSDRYRSTFKFCLFLNFTSFQCDRVGTRCKATYSNARKPDLLGPTRDRLSSRLKACNGAKDHGI